MGNKSNREVTRLRLVIALIFIALALPTAVLVAKAYSQLRREAFHQYQQQASELAERINRRVSEVIRAEEARASTDYAFLVSNAGSPAQSLQLSPLASWPPRSDIAGLLGHFQVDASGALQAPFVPDTAIDAGEFGIRAEEFAQRDAMRRRLIAILAESQLIAQQSAIADQREDHDLVLAEDEAGGASRSIDARGLTDNLAIPAETHRNEPAPAAGVLAEIADAQPAPFQDQAASEKKALSGLGRVTNLKLDTRYQQATAGAADDARIKEQTQGSQRQVRKERSTLAAAAARPGADLEAAAQASEASPPGDGSPVIRMFDSEVSPFQLRLLGSGYFVLYREVWRDGNRLVQGALIDSKEFISEYIGGALQRTALAPFSDLLVAWQSEVVSVLSAQQPIDYFSENDEFTGTELHSARLSAPLDDMVLIFSFGQLPVPAGASVMHWLSAILALVLCGGFLALYTLGMRQIALARQQQDFVSAVSHELKTPLTSIRMYGEILQAGWADENRKREYYQFIHDEAERLSRLISNVLQLARINRNDLQLDLKESSCRELLDLLQSKLATQVGQAGFTLEIDVDTGAADLRLNVDPDAFTQIMINLVDNALKFAAAAEPRQIDIAALALPGNRLRVTVRDYGSGIPEKQRKRIFELFYRAGSEMTRETSGTGIGLALVHQLVSTMGGEVSVLNRSPGAEFQVDLPARTPN